MDLKNNIYNLLDGRSNNFDIIRFIAATMVIYTHSFALSGTGRDIIIPFTNGQTHSGELGVMIFFVISGFLITLSYDRSDEIVLFIKSRILRIFPGLFVLLILTIFLFGPLVTSLPLKEYFSDPLTIKYFKSITLFDIELFLPGVFENNAWRPFVNGSLWTLKMEFAYYFIILFLGYIGVLKSKKFTAIFFVFTIIIAHINPLTSYLINNYTFDISTLQFFAIGIFFYVNREDIYFNNHLIGLSILMIILTARMGGFIAIGFIFISYLIFWVAFSPKIKMQRFGRYGDFSYGLYIYSFLIQQTVTHFFGGHMYWFVNFLISFIISLIFAYLSWHLIEKPFLKLKKTRILKFKLKETNYNSNL